MEDGGDKRVQKIAVCSWIVGVEFSSCDWNACFIKFRNTVIKWDEIKKFQ